MKKLFTIVGFGMLLASCGNTKKASSDLAVNSVITTSLDLTATTKDKVPVVINPGRFTQDTVNFRLPKVVQGTYSISDFGAFIDDFKAVDYNGNTIDVVKVDTNTWQITNATQLDKITYLVNDTFDVESDDKYPSLFSPGGTNIEPNNYVLNLHGFVGYFDSLKNNSYTIDVIAPSSFVRSSALQTINTQTNQDGTITTTTYAAPRYFDLTDNPMMYGTLDVEEFMVGDIKIVLSVYSPNQTHTAASLKETMYDMMKAQKQYLGDINSTPRYDIFLYLSDGKGEAPKGFGALEHHKSTVVVMREWASNEALSKGLVDVVSHEFFHIVTPLSVHSGDVHYFDYNAPTFSKHLWMYEGVTEYFAQHFQVYEGLTTPNEFYETIDRKIKRSEFYDDTMSFTEMSENIVTQPYEDNYLNVYQKGALIGMCIDIMMREESNGNRSMLSLMKELSIKYGKNKPFDDDTIIEDITAMTYPVIGEFLHTHIEGTTPINYAEYLAKVGLVFEATKTETNYIQTSKGFILDANESTQKIFFSKEVINNSFWAESGVKENDILKTVNGTELTLANARTMMGTMYRWKKGQDIEVVITRDGDDITIKKQLTPTYTTVEKLIENTNATEAQITLRKAWLNK